MRADMAAPASRPPDPAPATAPRRRAGRPSLRSFLLRPFLLPFTLLLGVGVAVTVGVHRNEDQLRLVSDAQTRMLLQLLQ